MDREINIDSNLALDREIAERAEEIIRLKRTRNSLKIWRTPPEVLGYIFCLSVKSPAIHQTLEFLG